MHVLRDALSRVPNAPIISNTHLIDLSLPEGLKENYKFDEVFGPISLAINESSPEDKIQKKRVQRLPPLFTVHKGLRMYEEKIFIHRYNIRDLMHLTHDCNVSGHFSTAKTLFRLQNFHSRNKSRYVERYFQLCSICQQFTMIDV